MMLTYWSIKPAGINYDSPNSFKHKFATLKIPLLIPQKYQAASRSGLRWYTGMAGKLRERRGFAIQKHCLGFVGMTRQTYLFWLLGRCCTVHPRRSRYHTVQSRRRLRRAALWRSTSIKTLAKSPFQVKLKSL